MEQNPFIFSDARKYRVARHLAFWAFWLLFQTLLYSFVARRYPFPFSERLSLSFIESFFYMTAYVFLAYSLMYWVIPRYVLPQKYGRAVIAVIFVSFVSALISGLISLTILDYIRGFYGRDVYPKEELTGLSIYIALMAGFRGALTIGGLAAAIKLMKYWYLKEQRNLQLQKQNSEAQLQLLKAQVHPHFLFNTLNNIYSHTQTTAPLAAELVAGLSGILRFILYESNQSTVPLTKELTLIREYIKLEQVRYSNGLDMHVDLPESADHLVIAPLLLLPLIENSFKHGSSRLLEQPWISVTITLEGNMMQFKLMNGKPLEPVRPDGGGLGLPNVKERLNLIYPSRHELVITDEEDVFIVNLKLELATASNTIVLHKKNQLVYE